MDARTPKKLLEGVDAKDLAIGIQITSQVGKERSITMTLGVPMIMDLPTLNSFMDKCASVLDRQNDKALLEFAKLTLEREEFNLKTNIENRESYYAQQALEYMVSGRRGDFTPNKTQQSQLSNFDATKRTLMETTIPKMKKTIADLERKIAEGV